MNKVSSLIALTLLCSSVCADERNLGKELAESISSEYAACAAFYSIISVGLESSGSIDDAATADKSAEVTLNYSYEAALAGRSKEMARKVSQSRAELYMQEMIKETDGDMSNISLLTNKYGYRCKKAIENPAAFVDEVIEETQKKLHE